MKRPLLSIIVGIAAMASVTYATDTKQPAAQAPAAAASHGHSGDGTVPGGDTGKSTTGKVVETMNAGTYTYVQVDDGTKKIWAAAPQFQVAVGDVVVVPEGAPMQNFESKTLGRTFDLVYFVEAIQVAGSHTGTAKEQIAAAHGAGTTKAPAVALDLSNIAKAAGGQTVAEVFANKTALAGKEVAIRGKVAKFTSSVMGKNWIHLKDGTGSAGSNDLTVTTSAEAAVGNTVLVHGKLSTDKDFGFGYKYDILIEDAAIAVE